jgi:hypothetical protein
MYAVATAYRNAQRDLPVPIQNAPDFSNGTIDSHARNAREAYDKWVNKGCAEITSGIDHVYFRVYVKRSNTLSSYLGTSATIQGLDSQSRGGGVVEEETEITIEE